MSEGVARLGVDGFRIGDIANSLDLVKKRLAEINQQLTSVQQPLDLEGTTAAQIPSSEGSPGNWR